VIIRIRLHGYGGNQWLLALRSGTTVLERPLIVKRTRGRDRVVAAGTSGSWCLSVPDNGLRVTGSPPWVNVTGSVVFTAILDAWTVNVQGTWMGWTFTLTGTLTGTPTPNEEGKAIGFNGTLQVDVPMYSPAIYNVTGTMSMPAAAGSP
jgi:hypothetical protein